MLAAGLLEEVRRVMARYGAEIRPLGALGYRQLRDHLLGHSSLEDAVARAQRDTRRYARRQLTWFKAEPGIRWHEDAASIDHDALERFIRAEE